MKNIEKMVCDSYMMSFSPHNKNLGDLGDLGAIDPGTALTVIGEVGKFFGGGGKKIKIPWIDKPVDITRDLVIGAGPAGATLVYPFQRKTNYKNSYSGFQDGDIALVKTVQHGNQNAYGGNRWNAFVFLPGNQWAESENISGSAPLISALVNGGDRAALNTGMLSITSEFSRDHIVLVQFGREDRASGTYIPLTEQEFNAKFPNQGGGDGGGIAGALTSKKAIPIAAGSLLAILGLTSLSS